jgi:aryl-alcohol dehydrogenase-like predicted oxidoreductase
MHMSELGAQLIPTITPEFEERKSPSNGTWQLGDLTVRRIGFGAKRLGGRGVVDLGLPGDAAQVKGLLRRAVELGVNHIDTAAFYPTFAHEGETRDFTGLNWANDAIRQALAPYPSDLVIATKVGPTESGLAKPSELRGLVEDNLRQLRLDCLDLVYLRQTGLESVAEHFGVLAELREAGLIRHLGLSNVRAEHLAQAQEIAPVVAVQNRYGVDFGRVNDAMLAACGEQGIAFVPFFALTGTGREAGGVTHSDPVETIARDHGATPAQIRIAWTLAQGPHVLAIPGTGNPAHLTENLAAATIQLTPEELTTLNALPSVD